MRVLYLGNFHDAFCTEWQVARALGRLGHEVTTLDTQGSTYRSIFAAAETGYDLLLFAKAQFREASGTWPGAADAVVRMIEAVRPHVPRIVCWLWDLMCEEFSPPRWQWLTRIAAASDMCALTDGVSAGRLPNAVVIRDGCPDDVEWDCEWTVELRGDVLFLGSVYGDRPRLLDALGRRLEGDMEIRRRWGGRFSRGDMEIRRRWGDRFSRGDVGIRNRLTIVTHGVRGPALTRLVRGHRLVVGPHYPCHPGYWSDRLTVVTGHGGLFAGPTIEGMQADGWKPGTNYLGLSAEPNAMVEQVVGYLEGDEGTRRRCGDGIPKEGTSADTLDTIRRAGFEHVKGKCGWDGRIRELLGCLRRRCERS